MPLPKTHNLILPPNNLLQIEKTHQRGAVEAPRQQRNTQQTIHLVQNLLRMPNNVIGHVRTNLEETVPTFETEIPQTSEKRKTDQPTKRARTGNAPTRIPNREKNREDQTEDQTNLWIRRRPKQKYSTQFILTIPSHANMALFFQILQHGTT